MEYKCQQIATRRVTVKSIINKAAFVRGYQDKLRGKPWAEVPAEDQWNYERGRLFACVYQGGLKDGRTVRYEAIYQLGAALESRAVI